MTDTLLRIAGDALNDAAAEFLLALEDQDQADSIADYEGPGDDDTAERAAVLATRRAGAAELRLKKCRMAWIEARALGGSVPSPSPTQTGESPEFERGIASVLFLRCLAHRHVPQLNTTEFSGGECGACCADIALAVRASSPGPSADPR